MLIFYYLLTSTAPVLYRRLTFFGKGSKVSAKYISEKSQEFFMISATYLKPRKKKYRGGGWNPPLPLPGIGLNRYEQMFNQITEDILFGISHKFELLVVLHLDDALKVLLVFFFNIFTKLLDKNHRKIICTNQEDCFINYYKNNFSS